MVEQLALPGAETLGQKPSRARRLVPAENDPYAVVAVLRAVPGLGGHFDYLVPARLSESAVPGARVRVRFRGSLTDGLVMRRTATTEVQTQLQPISSVSGTVVVPTWALAAWQDIADQNAGSFAEVARWGLSDRHAATEAAVLADDGPRPSESMPSGSFPTSVWDAYPAGAAWLSRVGQVDPVHAVWQAPPGLVGEGTARWQVAVLETAERVMARGRSVVIAVPDDAQSARLAQVAGTLCGAQRILHFSSSQSPSERYRAWLQALMSPGWCLIGSRSVAYLPACDVGLYVCWDDESELHRSRRAPYAHDREVMQVMASHGGASTLVGGFSLSAASMARIRRSDAVLMEPTREALRAWAPTVRVDDPMRGEARDGPAAYAHLPPVALRSISASVSRGSVLVQVPRRGYVPVVACRRCQTIITCPGCSLAVELTAEATTECPTCGVRPAQCPSCGHTGWRAVASGLERVAEEIQRALPSVTVGISHAGQRLLDVRHQVTVCTPGCEPWAGGTGHALAVALSSALGQQADAELSWLARVLRLGAGVRSEGEGGQCLIVGATASMPVRNAAARWAPRWAVERDATQRAEAGIPPEGWGAVIRTTASHVGWWNDYGARHFPPGTLLSEGSSVDGQDHTLWIRAPHVHAEAVTAALFAARGHAPGVCKVVVGPSPWW